MSPKDFRNISHSEPKILNSLVNCTLTHTGLNLELTPPEVGPLKIHCGSPNPVFKQIERQWINWPLQYMVSVPWNYQFLTFEANISYSILAWDPTTVCYWPVWLKSEYFDVTYLCKIKSLLKSPEGETYWQISNPPTPLLPELMELILKTSTKVG